MEEFHGFRLFFYLKIFLSLKYSVKNPANLSFLSRKILGVQNINEFFFLDFPNFSF